MATKISLWKKLKSVLRLIRSFILLKRKNNKEILTFFFKFAVFALQEEDLTRKTHTKNKIA